MTSTGDWSPCYDFTRGRCPAAKSLGWPVPSHTSPTWAPLSDEPVVSTTLKDERATQQPIPRRLAGGDLIVSARTREWACIEDTDTGLPESYYRLTALKQREDRLNPNESVS